MKVAKMKKTTQEVAMEMTEAEKEDVRQMKNGSKLYEKVRFLIDAIYEFCTILMCFTECSNTLSPLKDGRFNLPSNVWSQRS